MASIAYGVSGEGSGHAFRSREVIRDLISRGHRVHVFTYGRALQILSVEFACTEIAGFHLSYKKNAVQVIATLRKNLVDNPAMIEGLKELLPEKLRSGVDKNLRLGTRNVETIVRQCELFHPEVFVTDFEPFTGMAAARLGKNVISVDNINWLAFSQTQPPLRYRHHWYTARAIIKLFSLGTRFYFVLTFSPVYRKEKNVIFVPPIVRPQFLRAKSEMGEHVVVYDSFIDRRLPAVLRGVKSEFRIYGHNRNFDEGNLHFRKFSEDIFLNDLRTCRAVIGTGGFTLMSECLVLGKPYFALPARGQYEQIDNALQFADLGYGQMANKASVEDIENFLSSRDEILEHLASFHHPGNEETYLLIDEAVRRYCI